MMAYEYNQDSIWNGPTFYQQNLDTVPLETGPFFENPADPLTLNTSMSQFPGNLITEPPSVAYSDWGGSIQGDALSTGDFSPSNSQADNKRASISEASSRGPRRPSAEAIARRRKQNRVSQAAWRARNKELVEELRQEISEYSEYTENMQQTMKSLLETTESLKSVIEGALAQPSPKKSSQTGTNGESQLMSPLSTNDGHAQETQETKDTHDTNDTNDTQDCDGDVV